MAHELFRAQPLTEDYRVLTCAWIIFITYGQARVAGSARSPRTMPIQHFLDHMGRLPWYPTLPICCSFFYRASLLLPSHGPLKRRANKKPPISTSAQCPVPSPNCAAPPSHAIKIYSHCCSDVAGLIETFSRQSLFLSCLSNHFYFLFFLISLSFSSWRPSSPPASASPPHSHLFQGILSPDPSIPLLAYSPLLSSTCPSSPPASLVPPTLSSTVCSLVS